jgi:hypothetical protein
LAVLSGEYLCRYGVLNLATRTPAFGATIHAVAYMQLNPAVFDVWVFRRQSTEVEYRLHPRSIWAAEHAYTIYNRRFHEIQIISVYAAEVSGGDPTLNAVEHDASDWFTYEAALAAVHYRGLKDGLRSVREYVTGPATIAAELCLRAEKPATQEMP